jgi:cytidylate kinase
MQNIIIALDGPAGSGKSTTARLVAKELGYLYIDTGAMYRAMTLAALRANCAISEDAIKPLLSTTTIHLQTTNGEAQRTYLNDEDVTHEIRSQAVTRLVSAVSALASVREALVQQQRRLGAKGGVVMDGRDIGTVVFPNAELKIFLVASVEERAKRRLRELETSGTSSGEALPTLSELSRQLAERDRLDSERSISPLRKAHDAIQIDTSLMNIEQQTARIIELARSIQQKNSMSDFF